MSVLLQRDTACLIQGMTGKEGQRALAWMQANGTNVLAGVTPGKGGTDVAGVPVFNTVAEALQAFPEITVSSVSVPPRFVAAAVKEALDAGVSLLHIIAEGVPTSDTVAILEQARAAGARILGPSSIGVLCPGVGMLGQFGGGQVDQYLAPNPAARLQYQKYGVATLSKSGGMANTVATMLTAAGIAQTSSIGIGGDRVIGTTYADLLADLAADSETAAVVVIGEIGGAYEEVLAEQIVAQHFTKPLIAFISGLFAETLPQGVAFGHAGAIVSKTTGTRASKITALTAAGVHIAETPTEIPELIKRLLSE